MALVTINSNTFTPDTFFKLPRPDGASSGNEVTYTITTIDGVFTVKVLLNAGIVSNIKLSIGLTQVAEFDALDDLGLSQAAFEALWSDTSPNGEAVILGLMKGNDSVGSDTAADLDFFLTGDGNDNVTLGSGSSTINLGRGNDTVDGGEGFDVLIYDGPDGRAEGVTVTFANDRDGKVISNEIGFEEDTFFGIEAVGGTSKNDTFIGAAGAQVFRGALGNDTMDGGTGGEDEADYLLDVGLGGAGVTVDLVAGTATGGAGNDTLMNIEFVRGTQHADSLTGNGVANRLRGEGGNDALDGQDGNDSLEGGAGDDILVGGNGGDALEGGVGNDTIIGSTAASFSSSINDKAIFRVSTSGVLSQTPPNADGAFSIKQNGATVFEVRQLVNGDFEVMGVGTAVDLGKDIVSKVDILEFIHPGGNIQVNVGVVVTGTSDDLTITGGVFSNAIDVPVVLAGATPAKLVVKAGGGADQISGGEGGEIIEGEGGDDLIFGRGGADNIDGGAGNDTLNGGAGTDVIRGSAGSDVIDGGGGVEDISRYDVVGAGDLVKRVDAGGVTIAKVEAGVETALFRVTRPGDTFGGSFQVFDFADNSTDTVTNVAQLQFSLSGDANIETVFAGVPSLSLSGGSVFENSNAGTLAGRVIVTDPTKDDTAQFQLLDDAGGRFTIDQQGNLLTTSKVLFDFELATSHNVTVRVTDKDGVVSDRVFAIAVQNVNPEIFSGTNGNDTIFGGAEASTLRGFGGKDWLYGNDGKDTISGGSSDDRLFGGSGNDTLKGDSGNDRLYGGTGQDTMTGSSGKDRFYFDDKETSASRSKADYITDFKGDLGDRLYLSAIDANTRTVRDNKFTFIGEASEFTGTGQVRYEKMNGNTYVYYNNDRDAAADGVIRLKGEMDLAKNWFAL
ncbi:MAG TPA: calcium-binding protein [Microvirga sp.]|jgi:Ca2+-binding RTX toxin-like protein